MIAPLRIGTRGSRLALWQANHVADRLRPLAAPLPVELVEIHTAGDQVRKLAQAGLERLSLGDAITEVLDPSWMLPAVGQGALGLECRSDDRATLDLVARLDDVATRQAVTAERSLLFALGGGCQVPIGASARV